MLVEVALEGLGAVTGGIVRVRFKGNVYELDDATVDRMRVWCSQAAPGAPGCDQIGAPKAIVPAASGRRVEEPQPAPISGGRQIRPGGEF